MSHMTASVANHQFHIGCLLLSLLLRYFDLPHHLGPYVCESGCFVMRFEGVSFHKVVLILSQMLLGRPLLLHEALESVLGGYDVLEMDKLALRTIRTETEHVPLANPLDLLARVESILTFVVLVR